MNSEYYEVGIGFKNATIKMGWNGRPLIRIELYVCRVEEEPYKGRSALTNLLPRAPYRLNKSEEFKFF